MDHNMIHIICHTYTYAMKNYFQVDMAKDNKDTWLVIKQLFNFGDVNGSAKLCTYKI